MSRSSAFDLMAPGGWRIVLYEYKELSLNESPILAPFPPRPTRTGGQTSAISLGMLGARGPQGGRAGSPALSLESPCGHRGIGLGRLAGGFLRGPQFPHQWQACAIPATASWLCASLLQGHPCIMQQRETELWEAKGDAFSPAGVWACLSFPAGGQLSSLCL